MLHRFKAKSVKAKSVKANCRGRDDVATVVMEGGQRRGSVASKV